MTSPPDDLLRLTTPRLELVAADATLAWADVRDRAELGRLLDAQVPRVWPPAEMDDALEIFARALEAQPSLRGWMHWYWIRRTDRALIGNGGFGGLPQDGSVETGYSVLEEYRGQGYATEAVGALIGWARLSPDLKQVVAAVFPDNVPSVRVLEKNGFQREGPAADVPGALEFVLTV